MSENTKIEWADHTFNPWVGCTPMSSACDFCYAEGWAKRSGHPELWQGERRRTTAENWKQPLKWDRKAAAAGVRARVFCASLADVFDNQVSSLWRLDLWRLIQATPHLDWLLLTKRPQNIAKMVPAFGNASGVNSWGNGWPNVWLGVTAENQEDADRRIPILLAMPAAVSFVSMEPLLGPIDLTHIEAAATGTLKDGDFSYPKRINALTGEAGHYPGKDTFSPNSHRVAHLDWVICGGESGPHARPMHPDWPRKIRDDCVGAGVPFFFKQHGEWCPPGPTCEYDTSGRTPGLPRALIVAEEDGTVHHFGETAGENGKVMLRIGKRAAGRLLDGVEHNGMPA